MIPHQSSNHNLEVFPNPDYFGIIRVSSVEQLENGSLVSQRAIMIKKGVPKDQILELVASLWKQEPEIIESFLDDRVSPQVVLFIKPDRLTRSYHWGVDQVNRLYRRGVFVWPLNFNSKLTNKRQLHKLYLQFGEAELSIKKNKAAVKEGIEKAKRSGNYKGGTSKLSASQRNQLNKYFLRVGPTGCVKHLPLKFSVSRITIWRYRKNFAAQNNWPPLKKGRPKSNN